MERSKVWGSAVVEDFSQTIRSGRLRYRTSKEEFIRSLYTPQRWYHLKLRFIWGKEAFEAEVNEMSPPSFEESVFINCPFDDEYTKLLRPLLFTILFLGKSPRLTLERSDSGKARIDKIVELVQDSKFGIHDLSRCCATAKGELYRLNMPLELGIDLGAASKEGNGKISGA
jgi:hypothetical protein